MNDADINFYFDPLCPFAARTRAGHGRQAVGRPDNGGGKARRVSRCRG